MINKNILIISYKYPPYPGVGGYRWSKMTKYLARIGYNIHVVTVPWAKVGENTNESDVIHENITIHRIRSGYPHNLNINKHENKLVNILQRIYLRLLNSLIFWDDEAQYWSLFLLPACREIIQNHDINIIIATGHPFQSIRHAATLKKNFPKVKLIADFRDPWIQHENYRPTGLRRARAKKWMKYILKTANVNVFVTKGLITEYLNYLHPNVAETIKVKHISNGVDLDAVPQIEEQQILYDFIYAGNITNGREEPCLVFLEAISKIAPDTKIILIGVVPSVIILMQKHLPYLKIMEPISQEEVFSYIKKAKIALHFNAKKVPYALSTKIYEYPALGKPTLSINYGGEIVELIQENSWGVSFHADDNYLIDKLKEVINAPPQNVNLPSDYTYEAIADKYAEVIDSIY